MSSENKRGKKSNDRRKSVRSSDIAKKVLEEMEAREAESSKKKDKKS